MDAAVSASSRGPAGEHGGDGDAAAQRRCPRRRQRERGEPVVAAGLARPDVGEAELGELLVPLAVLVQAHAGERDGDTDAARDRGHPRNLRHFRERAFRKRTPSLVGSHDHVWHCRVLGRARRRPPGHHDRAHRPPRSRRRRVLRASAGQPRPPPARRSSTSSAVTSPSAPTTAGCSSSTTARSTTSGSCAPSSKPLGHTFPPRATPRSCSTPTLEWGTDCFARFNGMWALAILDLRADEPASRGSCSRATTTASSRSTGPGRARARIAVRVRDQGAARRPRARRRARPPVAVRLPAARAARPPAARPLHRASGPLAAATWAVVDADGVHEQHLLDTRRSPPTAPADPAEFRERSRALGGAPPGRRRPRRHLPVGRASTRRRSSCMVEPPARGARPRRGVAGRPAEDVLDRLRRRPDRRARVHDAVLAEIGAEPAFARPDVGAVRRGARPAGLAPGRADRLHRRPTRSGA